MQNSPTLTKDLLKNLDLELFLLDERFPFPNQINLSINRLLASLTLSIKPCLLYRLSYICSQDMQSKNRINLSFVSVL